MKKNILFSMALTFVSSVVWSGVDHLNSTPRVGDESKSKEFFAHVAHVNPEDNLYLLSIPDLDGEKVEITILDEDNNVLFSERKAITKDFSQAFRVEGQSGDIVFEVWNKEDKQVKTFRFPPSDGNERSAQKDRTQ